MKVFKHTRIYGAVIGIVPIAPGVLAKYNRRNLTVLLIFGVFFILSTAFILFDANTLKEHANAFFLWISVLVTFFAFFAVINIKLEMCDFLDKTEKIAENRKHMKFEYFNNETNIKVNFKM